MYDMPLTYQHTPTNRQTGHRKASLPIIRQLPWHFFKYLEQNTFNRRLCILPCPSSIFTCSMARLCKKNKDYVCLGLIDRSSSLLLMMMNHRWDLIIWDPFSRLLGLQSRLIKEANHFYSHQILLCVFQKSILFIFSPIFRTTSGSSIPIWRGEACNTRPPTNVKTFRLFSPLAFQLSPSPPSSLQSLPLTINPDLPPPPSRRN